MNVSRHRRLSRVLLAAAICGALTQASVKAQTAYTYTVIADMSACFNWGNPVINNKWGGCLCTDLRRRCRHPPR